MGTLEVGAECYDLVATVGKGTFGEVAQGRRRSTGEMVVIKILKNKRYHRRVVKNELRLLQALRGVDTEESHIVRFLESFTDGASTYLVFELLEQNLRDFQEKNNFLPLPVWHIHTITVQLLVALVQLKELSIIHADLKPENTMLVDHARYPFHVKLVDFGSACILTEVCHVKQLYIQTRFYRAPEILLGLPFCEKLHLGRPLYPGINEYDQVRYICSTLGLPRGELLCAAWKTSSFFQRVPHPTGSWQLRPPGEEMAKLVERRRYVFSSLDQLAAVHIRPASDSGQEALAEHGDLRGMVALLKTMLTWDSRERITPSAALEHPFISLRQVKSSFEATQYYQLCHKDLRASRKDAGAVQLFPGTEEGAFIPASQRSTQEATTQTDGLSLGQGAPGRGCSGTPGAGWLCVPQVLWCPGCSGTLVPPDHGCWGVPGAPRSRVLGSPWWSLGVPGPHQGVGTPPMVPLTPSPPFSPAGSSGDAVRPQATKRHPCPQGWAPGDRLGLPHSTWHTPPGTEPGTLTSLLSHRGNPGTPPGREGLPKDLPLPHLQPPRAATAGSTPVEKNGARDVLCQMLSAPVFAATPNKWFADSQAFHLAPCRGGFGSAKTRGAPGSLPVPARHSAKARRSPSPRRRGPLASITAPQTPQNLVFFPKRERGG
uniref:Homeodomain interacting protein kinase 4 n=1 Tax=Otus sunia TaxID=257818 RepID=A0A8C8AGN3_9STRI